MEKIQEILSITPLFSDLPQEQIQQLRQIVVTKHSKKGDTVFSEGDNCTGFYIVADGSVKIFKVSSEGKEHILHILGQGEPIGEVPVFSGQPFPASAQTLEKSHLIFIPRAAFVAMISANPSLSLNMLAVLSRRLRQFTVQIENISLKEVPGRLASYLIHMSEEQGNKDRVSLNISKGQLASLLGTIPETLSRIFSRLTSKNLIEVNGRDIRILKHEELRDIAENGISR